MKVKRIVTLLLLVFVAASVAFLIAKETGNQQSPGETAQLSGGKQALDPSAIDAAGVDRKVIVYYFHGDTRCNTCRTIESYTEEAIRTGFEDELASGRLVWKVVNVERDANEHFIDDYELSTRTVVLSDVDREQEVRWTRLEQVWQLVKDKEEFMDYIIKNTNEYLAGQDG
ncbi:MAG: nitrophenyl compound nitroreductase subunit ArsF family protein [Candidatus Latescibacterota bacterium]